MLTLSIGKRYTDLNATDLSAGASSNRMFIGYTPELLKVLILVILVVNLSVYIAYTMYSGTVQRVGSSLYFLTALPVGIGLFRYSKQILQIKNSASPVRLLLQDKVLKICLVLWLILVAFFNYQSHV